MMQNKVKQFPQSLRSLQKRLLVAWVLFLPVFVVLMLIPKFVGIQLAFSLIGISYFAYMVHQIFSICETKCPKCEKPFVSIFFHWDITEKKCNHCQYDYSQG